MANLAPRKSDVLPGLLRTDWMRIVQITRDLTREARKNDRRRQHLAAVDAADAASLPRVWTAATATAHAVHAVAAPHGSLAKSLTCATAVVESAVMKPFFVFCCCEQGKHRRAD